jgi:HD-GYP domain-containing protein (c-di-GMP phosphodiesterase class II)
MTSDRPYRKGLPRRQVIDMLSQKSGTQFDPRVIECFVEMCAEEDTGTPEPACAASASQ